MNLGPAEPHLLFQTKFETEGRKERQENEEEHKDSPVKVVPDLGVFGAAIRAITSQRPRSCRELARERLESFWASPFLRPV